MKAVVDFADAKDIYGKAFTTALNHCLVKTMLVYSEIIYKKSVLNIVTRHETDSYHIGQQSKQDFLSEYYNVLSDYD